MATVDFESRVKFDNFFRGLIAQNSSKINIPAEGLVYDYYFQQQSLSFVPWRELFKSWEIDPKLGNQYHEIVIPTDDSTRNIFYKKLLLTNGFHVMCPGPTGTGNFPRITPR